MLIVTRFFFSTSGLFHKECDMRSILLLLLGVPIPIIILVALLTHL